MKRKIIIIFLLLFSALLVHHGIAYGNKEPSIWQKFVNNPNLINYKICQIAVWKTVAPQHNRFDNPITKELSNNYDLYDRFLDLIKKRNIYALELGMQIYPFTNGGNLEDLYQAIGTVIVKDTELFLYLIVKYNIDDDDVLEDMIGMYPLEEVTDNLGARIRISNERLEAFKAIKRETLIITGNKCIKILEERLRDENAILKKLLKELESKRVL